MGWLSKFKEVTNKLKQKTEPEKELTEEEIYGQKLKGNENECEHCHGPIFQDTEKWTKLQGHYFHRICWKLAKRGIKHKV